jgi:1-acyl-sn-glycerol-3-phosphate acyltransferase
METCFVDQPFAVGTRYFPVPAYDTPEQLRKPLFFRVCPFASLRFYGSMLYCVLWARRRAAQGRFDQAALAYISSVTTRSVEWAGGRLHFRGLDELDKSPGPAVIIGNHMSSLETFMLPGLVIPAKPLGFVVKDSLTRHPLFGPVMRSTRHIAVSRTNARKDLQTVLEEGAKLLREGVSFCIFPQATRRFEFSEAHFNTLGVKLARRAGVPVIPVAVRSDFWGNGRIVKDVGRIHPERDVYLAFGPALPPTLPPQEVHQAVVRFVRGRLQEWGVPCLAASDPQTEV